MSGRATTVAVLALLWSFDAAVGNDPPDAISSDDFVSQPAFDANDADPNDGVRTPPQVASRTGVTAALSTLDALPPGFDGKSVMLVVPGRSLTHWKSAVDAVTAEDWSVDEKGNVRAGRHDLATIAPYRDFQLHFEYSLPRTPGRIGINASSTGVRVHDRYDIEFRNDFGRPPKFTSTGAVLGMVAPVVNAVLPAPGWQAVDIYFRAPRIESGVLLEAARLSMMVNGVLVQNNVVLEPANGGWNGDPPPAEGPIILEGSEETVYFRNIWIRPS
ncbi:MAG: DUF1080 domain-containing protein [Planctomycetota bacterium]|jgi:hypothetical protein|nr:DUF1080 domain-containing protein [Planctomycetota bacterium]